MLDSRTTFNPAEAQWFVDTESEGRQFHFLWRVLREDGGPLAELLHHQHEIYEELRAADFRLLHITAPLYLRGACLQANWAATLAVCRGQFDVRGDAYCFTAKPAQLYLYLIVLNKHLQGQKGLGLRAVMRAAREYAITVGARWLVWNCPETPRFTQAARAYSKLPTRSFPVSLPGTVPARRYVTSVQRLVAAGY